MRTNRRIFSKGSDRNSGTELLRVIAMLFIIASHFSGHSGFNISKIAEKNLFSAVFLQMSILGNVGIDIFMCIYGYYNVFTESYSKTIERVIRISLMVLFYSGILFIVFVLLGYTQFTETDAKKAFFPLLHDEYGFPTVYTIVSLISPLINKGITSLSESKRRMMVVMCLLIWTIIPTFSFGRYNHYGTTLGQYALLYFLGGNIRIEFGDSSQKRKYGRILIVLSVFLIGMITVLYDVIPDRVIPIIMSLLNIYSRESLFSIMLACGLVMYFTAVSFRSSFINTLGSLTFGIYLFHDNKYIRANLWTNWLHCAQFSFSPILPLYEIGIIAVVFLGSGMIEYIRMICLDGIFYKISKKITNMLRKIYGKLIKAAASVF